MYGRRISFSRSTGAAGAGAGAAACPSGTSSGSIAPGAASSGLTVFSATIRYGVQAVSVPVFWSNRAAISRTL